MPLPGVGAPDNLSSRSLMPLAPDASMPRAGRMEVKLPPE